MRNKLMLACVAVGVLFLLSGCTFAHHGAAAYDSSKPVTVTGTVTDFEFVNPHVLISMDVKDPSTGKIEIVILQGLERIGEQAASSPSFSKTTKPKTCITSSRNSWSR